MNALRATVLLSSCSVAALNFLLTPQKTALSTAKASLASARSEFDAQRSKEDSIKQIPVAERFRAKPVDESVLALVTKWQSIRADYGVDLREITSFGINVGGSQDGKAIAEAAVVNPISGLRLFTMTLSGNYLSLSDFQTFVEGHVMSSASTVSKITMKGSRFEVVVDVIGT